MMCRWGLVHPSMAWPNCSCRPVHALWTAIPRPARVHLTTATTALPPLLQASLTGRYGGLRRARPQPPPRRSRTGASAVRELEVTTPVRLRPLWPPFLHALVLRSRAVRLGIRCSATPCIGLGLVRLLTGRWVSLVVIRGRGRWSGGCEMCDLIEPRLRVLRAGQNVAGFEFLRLCLDGKHFRLDLVIIVPPLSE